MPDPRAGGRLRLVRGSASDLRDDAVQIEGEGAHRQLAVDVAPFIARAIAIDLDAVSVRVGQVERFAYEMVRGAIERPSRAGEPGQRKAEVGPAWEKDRQVEEARRLPVKRRRGAVATQLDERLSACNGNGQASVRP